MKAKFKAKTRTILETGTSEDFNSYCIIIEAGSIMIMKISREVSLCM